MGIRAVSICLPEVFIIMGIDVKIETRFSCVTWALSRFSLLVCLNGFNILLTFAQGKYCTDNVQTAPTWRQQWSQHFDGGELGTRNQNSLVQTPERGASSTIFKLLNTTKQDELKK